MPRQLRTNFEPNENETVEEVTKWLAAQKKQKYNMKQRTKMMKASQPYQTRSVSQELSKAALHQGKTISL